MGRRTSHIQLLEMQIMTWFSTQGTHGRRYLCVIERLRKALIKGSRLEMGLEGIYIKKTKVKGIYISGIGNHISVVEQLAVYVINLEGRRGTREVGRES